MKNEKTLAFAVFFSTSRVFYFLFFLMKKLFSFSLGLGVSLLWGFSCVSMAAGVEYLKTLSHQVIKVPMDRNNQIVVPALPAR